MKKLMNRLVAVMVLGAMLIGVAPTAFALTGEVETGGTVITIDYSDYDNSDLTDYTVAPPQGSTAQGNFSIASDTVGQTTQNVLKFTTTSANKNSFILGTIPLGQSISTTNGKEFTIKLKAKVSGISNRPLRGFPVLSDGTTDSVFGLSWMNGNTQVMINANSFVEGIWLYKGTNSSGATVNTGSGVYNNIDSVNDRFFINLSGTGSASSQYVTYKWVVDPQNKTFRFYYSTNDGASWTEPYSSRTMLNTNTTDVADDRLPAGVFPTGTLPSTISHFKIREVNHSGSTNTTPNSTYIASIEVEQGVERPSVTSTSILDGAENVSNNARIDVSFDMEILPSSVTKENFSLVKVGSGAVSQDMYSLEQSADKKTVSVILNEGYSYDFAKTYRLTVKGVKANTQLAAQMETTKKVTFEIEVNPDAPGGVGGFEGEIDYSTYTDADVSGYNGNSSTYSIKDGALEIKTTAGSGNNTTVYPKIPLGDIAFKTTDGNFSVQIRAKLPETTASHIRQFPSYSDGTTTYVNGLGYYTNDTILYINANNRADAMWTRKRHNGEDASTAASDNNVDLTNLDGRFFATLGDVNTEFYDFRYDVEPAAGVFRFYYKKASETEWTEPWSSNYMINSATGARYTKAGVFPIGQGLPENITQLAYRVVTNPGADVTLWVKSIKIEQLDVPSIASVKINGAAAQDGVVNVEPDSQFDIAFSTIVVPDTITKDNIYIEDTATGEKLSQDAYSIAKAADNKAVTLTFNQGYKLDYAKKYAVKIEKLKAFTEMRGEMKSAESFNFTTLASYSVDNIAISQTAADVNVAFDFSDYVRENAGKKHAIIVNLVDKTTNTTYAVKAVSATSVDDGNANKTTPYNFNLLKPEGFDETKFEVRIYLWDDFVNSKGILKINKDVQAAAQ